MLAPGSQHAYRFIQADTPELRRLPWARMQDEGLAHAVLWDRIEPTVLDWLDTVSPRTTLTGLAFDDVREGRLAGALWVVPAGLSGTVHFVIFRDWQHDSLRLGREAVAWIFRTWPLRSLLAAYPASYRHLHGFMAGLGFTLWPQRLRGGCHMPGPGAPARCRDMAFASLDRNNL